MPKIYADLIEKGAICPRTGEVYTLEDVPAKIRNEVKQILIDDGYLNEKGKKV